MHAQTNPLRGWLYSHATLLAPVYANSANGPPVPEPGPYFGSSASSATYQGTSFDGNRLALRLTSAPSTRPARWMEWSISTSRSRSELVWPVRAAHLAVRMARMTQDAISSDGPSLTQSGSLLYPPTCMVPV